MELPLLDGRVGVRVSFLALTPTLALTLTPTVRRVLITCTSVAGDVRVRGSSMGWLLTVMEPVLSFNRFQMAELAEFNPTAGECSADGWNSTVWLNLQCVVCAPPAPPHQHTPHISYSW